MCEEGTDRGTDRQTESVLATMQTASAPLSLDTHKDAQRVDTVTQEGGVDEERGGRGGGGSGGGGKPNGWTQG